ncbi:MAG: zinc-dependent alcohol dehydrogenase family protein [Chlamydiae bacterium]|nr:zinc-dependent alcohol dehydrogenase family protein [Chlamydiota bacterium]
MVFKNKGQPLIYEELPIPIPSSHQILIKVYACGVCRTDLHIFEGDLINPELPLIPGHQIVGDIVSWGKDVTGFKKGERIGIAWLGKTCQQCYFCKNSQENLCDRPLFTGYTTSGGYAEYAVCDSRYCFSLPEKFDDLHVAPLLCAGMVGFRSLHKVLFAETIGFYGFGSSASLLIQTALSMNKRIYAFTKEGNLVSQQLAIDLGATWAGDCSTLPPLLLDAAIIFAPIGELVPLSLTAIRKGGTVVLGGIHMSQIPSFSYDLLWGERTLTSTANLTRQDGHDYFKVISAAKIYPLITVYPLSKANEAITDLKAGRIKGSLVLQVSSRD